MSCLTLCKGKAAYRVSAGEPFEYLACETLLCKGCVGAGGFCAACERMRQEGRVKCVNMMDDFLDAYVCLPDAKCGEMTCARCFSENLNERLHEVETKHEKAWMHQAWTRDRYESYTEVQQRLTKIQRETEDELIKEHPNHVLAAVFRRESRHREEERKRRHRQAELEAAQSEARAAQKSKASKRARPAVNYDERE